MLIALPFILDLYGPAYQQGAVVVALFITTAVAHMGGAPAAIALLVVDLRVAAFINLGWAVSVVALATTLVPGYGAAGAAAAWLLSHVGSQVLVQGALRRRGRLPAGTAPLWSFATAGVIALAGLTVLRSLNPRLAVGITLAQGGLLVALLATCAVVGRSCGEVPRDLVGSLAMLHLAPSRLLAMLVRSRRVGTP
jgi:O-antigen/teichoic acid export membrane protein